MPNIFGSQWKANNTFDFLVNNPNLSFMSRQDFKDKTGLSDHDSYYQAHDKFYAQRLIDVNGIKEWGKPNFKFFVESPEANIFKNKKAWERSFNIFNNGGQVLSFDTETIGLFDDSNINYSRLTQEEIETTKSAIENIGITEIGFSHHRITGALSGNYGGVHKLEEPAGSFFFGIDSKQKSWLESVLDKKVRGKKLIDAENSAMERMSRYSTIGEHAFSTFSDEWRGQQYTFVKQLNESRPDDVAHIKSGIEATSKLYNKNRDAQISYLMNYIDSFQDNKDNRVVIGQNLNYDITVGNKYASSHGLDWKGFSDNFEYADTLTGFESVAKSENATIPEMLKAYNPNVSNARGKSLEAMEESMSGSSVFARQYAHNAYSDTNATANVFTNKSFKLIDKVHNILNDIQRTPNELLLSESLIKINSSGNIRSQDVLTVDDQVTTAYQTANQYWKYIGLGETDYTGIEFKGKVIADTANKKVARLESANGDGATLFKAFDSEDDFQTWLRKNTSIVPTAQADIALQTRIHDRDIARRVIDGFFDPGQVSTFGYGQSLTDAGGFASFKKYYDMYEDLASLSEDAVTSMHIFDANRNAITNSQSLLKSINIGDNIDSIIEYADNNGLENISSFFRTSKAKSAMTAHEVAIANYDQRKVMQQVFDVFDANREFFDYANKEISNSGITENLVKTTAFERMQQAYMSGISTRINIDSDLLNGYSIDDLNAVSVLRNNTYSRIDTSDISHGATQLNRIASKDSDELFRIAQGFAREGILTDDQLNIIKYTHGLKKQPWTLAESIVTHLNQNIEPLRELGASSIGTIHQRLLAGDSVSDIADTYGIDSSLVNLIQNKDKKTLLTSSVSQMAQITGSLSNELKETLKQELEVFKNSDIQSGYFDEANFGKVKAMLLNMNYDEESINEFNRVFYKNGRTLSNLGAFNKAIGDGQQELKTLFFRSDLEDTSAFAIFTRKSDYTDVYETLSNLALDNKNATNSQVKEALRGKASFLEIPYLKRYDVAENKQIKALTGHGAQTVLVKQGDNYWRYDTLSLNAYETIDKNGNKVLKGGIKDQGGSFLTSIRQHANTAFTEASLGNYESSTRSLNRANIAREMDAAAPQIAGTFDLSGNFKKIHSVTQKDIDYAYSLALNPGEGNLSLKDILGKLTSEQSYNATADGASKRAQNALRGILGIFNKEYSLVYEKQMEKGFTETNVNRVFNSEPFKHFYERYLTSQTGGIGTEKIIQDALNNVYSGTNITYYLKDLKEFRDYSLLQIMAVASQDNSYVDERLSKTLNALANDVDLDMVMSESATHKMMAFIGGHNPQKMNNSSFSGNIRPTYSQRANYLPYRLDGNFFENPDELSSNLGIHFGDVYTNKAFIEEIENIQKQELAEKGIELTSSNVSRRNIVGAVQSISDAEIKARYNENLGKLITNNQDLNENALRKVYDRMINDINTFEGKAYMRPSLANENFFLLGDPKTMKSPEIKSIFDIGTQEERVATSEILSGLEGKRIESGTVIGRRKVEKGFKDIIYNGPTITELTKDNIQDLMDTGRTLTTVEQQIESFKVMFGEEKATAESLLYFRSFDQAAREREIIDTLQSLGLSNQGSFTENKRLLNRYTDAVYDVLSGNNTAFKTVLLSNNNIFKHLTDMSIDSKWNIIASRFINEKNGLEKLKSIANQNKGIRLADGTLLSESIEYDPIMGTFTFAENKPGRVNALDELVKNISQSEYSDVADTIRYFERNNIALQSIQRQKMNTFQGEAFKMDQRLYQGLMMQSQMFEGIEDNGAMLAETLRSAIQEGDYDRKIGGIGLNNIDSTWSDIVRTRRGTIRPKFVEDQYLGTLDAINYLYDENFNINTKNILTIDAQDLLKNIPKTGTGLDGYSNLIFKNNGNFTDYLRAVSQAGSNNAFLDASSNSFYLDLSSFGKFDFGGKKGLTGVLLPYQYLDSTAEDIYVGKSTRETIHFFNELKLLDPTKNNKANIEEALKKLFNAYSKELDVHDKESLLYNATFKFRMPSSSGALAKDAVVPVAELDMNEISNIRTLRNDILDALDDNTSIRNINDKINSLTSQLERQTEKIAKQKDRILSETDDVVSLLKLTSGNTKYADYLRHYDESGKLVGNVIESAIVTSKEMFKNTEMDTGHIGWQVAQDYFTGGSSYGIGKYDSFSKITKKAFYIEDTEMLYALIKANETLNDDKIRNALTNALNKTEKHVRDAQGNIIVKDGQAVMKQLSTYDRVSYALTVFDKTLNEHLADANLSDTDKRELLLKVNQAFENIGDRYAKEVGILGLTGRYPFFNETGTLPVRIYLDDTLNGKEIRFLGPQFSKLQNLDFDGDTEFLKFLGNGGLLAKNAIKKVRRNSEYDLMVRQFNAMNAKNTGIFAKALDDSLKDYYYGDESLFRATLLKEISNADYEKAETNLLSSLDKEYVDALSKLKEADEMSYNLVVSHTAVMKKAVRKFDNLYGGTIEIPAMIKAAIQARVAKEYIGNFSKPNLEIRNAMNYMMSLAKGDELDKLRKIRSNLLFFDLEPGGLLTDLEQKGIDTKHVHDAANLNNSSAWRTGVTRLFNNAKGASKIDSDVRKQAIMNLVEGSSNVYFKDAIQSREDIVKIAQEILDTPFEKWNDLTDDVSIGKKYIRSLYELSLMDNAYQGFRSRFRSPSMEDIFEDIQALNNKEIIKLAKSGNDLGSVTMNAIYNAVRRNGTDDAFTAFGRAIRNGDILEYATENGPAGLIFQEMRSVGSSKTAIFKKFDFATGKAIDESITFTGLSIRNLNEAIKKYGNGSLINFTDVNTPEHNLSIRTLDNMTSKELKENVSKHAAETYMGSRIQWFFDNADSTEAVNEFNRLINQDVAIPGYNMGRTGGRKIGTIASDLFGTDAEAFLNNVRNINERLEFGINNGMIAGSSDAKELIRSINKEIAKNPRDNIGRIGGDSLDDTINNYLRTKATVLDKSLFKRDIQDIITSNDIYKEVQARIDARNKEINNIALNFYNQVTNQVDETKAFNEAREQFLGEVQQASKDIYSYIEKSKNKNEELFNAFGWTELRSNGDFKINLSSDIIKTRIIDDARIGFGQFTGTRLEDVTQIQERLIQQEIDAALPALKKDSLEELAALNTRELLKLRSRYSDGSVLNFTNAETLRTSFKALNPSETLDNISSSVAKESLKESAAEAAREAFSTEKKTLKRDILDSLKNMSPQKTRAFKIGAGVSAGLAALGLVGHALFNNNSNESVEVPASVEHSLKQHGGNATPRINNKNDLGYENAPSSAKSTQKQHKVAPPSMPKNRTIYHDAGSGFNFKVSAQSYNKLQEESYERMASQAGLNNNSLHISRDNSRITDNWLENKFAQLTE